MEYDTSTPIYLQLVQKINRQILRNELKAGDKLPSVREMAVNSSVNPNTIQRTYSELERMGIVETRRGQGTFVTENEPILMELREELKLEQIKKFVKDMEEMGYNFEEMLNGVRDYIEVYKKENKKND